MDDVLNQVEKKAEEIENNFITNHVHEEFMPLFDFPINLNESD